MRALTVLAAALFSVAVQAAERPPGFAVASAHPLATQAGIDVLEAGGNAFDAAVAVTAALAVVEPTGSGIGGGGFYVLHRAEDGRKIYIDAREKAPLAAHRDMYLNTDGEVDSKLLRSGPLAAGIPGTPAGMVHLSRYGRLPLKRLLAPAIRHAEEGFAIDAHLAGVIKFRQEELAASPAAAAIFLPGGTPLEVGERLVQKDLGATLRVIAEDGASGFYYGKFAKKLVKAVRAGGGIWSRKDFKKYRSIERAPVVLEFEGWEIVSAAPPSSGGLVMGQVFNMLSAFDWRAMNRIDRVHLLTEAWRRAYRDRALYMGDVDFVDVPSGRLLSRDYAAELAAGIDMQRATPSAALGDPPTIDEGGRNTTHFSIIDAAGNRVAATFSINWWLGAAWVAPGTGIILNNEMDDFVAKPGAPNGFGLVGGEANAIEPEKRMLSSMTPTLVSGEDRVAVLGTPGGSRIITMVMLGVLGVIEGKGAGEIVAEPRFHHQYLPDVLQHEKAMFSEAEKQALKARGHTLKEQSRDYGNLQVVIWDREDKRLDAATDPRREGLAYVSRPSAAGRAGK